jgi:N-methylhydantoinase B
LDVREQLEEAASAMGATVRRAAASGGIGRNGGSAAGFYTATGALLIGGRESHPLLLEAAAEALGCLVQKREGAGHAFGPEELYWTNDPRCGAAGLEDLVLAIPVMRDDRLVCFAALTASHTALGRAALGPVESLHREGVVLPWTRIGHSGAVQTEMLEIVAANADTPAEFEEDLRAHRHALCRGQQMMGRLLDQHGARDLASIWEVWNAGTRHALAGILRRLDGKLVEGRVPPFHVRIRGQDGGVAVHVSYSGEPERLVLTPALARAGVRAAFREILAAESPAASVLGGWTEAVRIEHDWDQWNRDGFLGQAPTGEARFTGARCLADAVLAAFAEELPHLVRAPDAGSVLFDIRGERADRTRYRIRLELGGGLGASVFGDGMNHAGSPFFPHRLCPAEAIEGTAPLRVLRFAMCPDSAGPGQYRGGAGAVLEVELLEGRAEVDVLLPGRASGLRGGMRGSAARLVLVTPEAGMREEIGPALVTLHPRAGHRLILESPGGGGWGIPFQRSIMRIEEDLLRGLISRDQSKNRYGVVLRPGTLEKDDHLTYRVRHYLLSALTADDIIAGEDLLD